MKFSSKYFILSVYISEIIVIHTFRLMLSSHLQLLLVETSYLNRNLNHILYSILVVGLINCSVRPVNSVNDFVSIRIKSFCRNLKYLFCSILSREWKPYMQSSHIRLFLTGRKSANWSRNIVVDFEADVDFFHVLCSQKLRKYPKSKFYYKRKLLLSIENIEWYIFYRIQIFRIPKSEM